MLRQFLVLVGMVAMVGSAWAQPPAAEPAPGLTRVAVLPLQGATSGHLGDVDDAVYQAVVGAFLRTRRFELVERRQVEKLVKEQAFQQSGLVDEAGAAKLGQLLGATWVVLGSYRGELIAFYGDKAANNPLMRWYTSKLTCNLRLVEVESGRIRETFEAAGGKKDSTLEKTRAGLLEDCRTKLDRVVANAFPLTGLVLRVEAGEVMVDLGKQDGVAVGDRFQAVELTPDVVHPVTGKRIKGAPRVLGELKVVSVGPESCLMKPSGLKEPLKPGHRVESLSRRKGMWESLVDLTK